ncbi:Myc-type, basic helix-loop-helix (bHLH) domain, partial [Dillenia turbinata]
MHASLAQKELWSTEETEMAVSVSVLAIVISLHLIAFIFAVGAERRRSTAKVVSDEYDERTYCVYTTDASTVYGLSAFGLLLISQTVLYGVTRCLCFGRGLMSGTTSATCAVFFFIFSCLGNMSTLMVMAKMAELEVIAAKLEMEKEGKLAKLCHPSSAAATLETSFVNLLLLHCSMGLLVIWIWSRVYSGKRKVLLLSTFFTFTCLGNFAALIARKTCVFSKRLELCFGLESLGIVQLRMKWQKLEEYKEWGEGMDWGGKEVITWVSFLAAEACLLAGSARNAYHTKYRGFFGAQDLSCTTLRKGVFAAGAALVLLSMLSSVFYYWLHSRADTGGWQKHQNEGLGMTSPSLYEHQHQNTSEFSKGQTVQVGAMCGLNGLYVHEAYGAHYSNGCHCMASEGGWEDVMAVAHALSSSGLQVTAMLTCVSPRSIARITNTASAAFDIFIQYIRSAANRSCGGEAVSVMFCIWIGRTSTDRLENFHHRIQNLIADRAAKTLIHFKISQPSSTATIVLLPCLLTLNVKPLSSQPRTRDTGSSLIPNIEDSPFTCSTNPITSLGRPSCSMNYGLGVASDDLSDVLGFLWDTPLDPKYPSFEFNKDVFEDKGESSGAKRIAEVSQSPQSHCQGIVELSERPSGKRPKQKRSAESHNMSERRRRDRIGTKMTTLQQLIPNCNKTDKVAMLEDAVKYIKTLKSQVQMMRMSRSTVCQVPYMQPSAPIWPGVGENMHMHMQSPVGMAQTSPNMFSSPSSFSAFPLLPACGHHYIPNMQMQSLSAFMSLPNSAAFKDLNNAAQWERGADAHNTVQLDRLYKLSDGSKLSSKETKYRGKE